MIDHDVESPVSALTRLEAVDRLGRLADAVRGLAREGGLSVFPAVPDVADEGAVAEVTAEHMELADFIGLSAEVGARVLYLDVERLSLDAVERSVVVGDDEGSAELDALRRAAARFDGFTSHVTVAFVCQQVWHMWSQTASFVAPIDTATESRGGGGLYDEMSEDDEPSLGQDECDRLVQVLCGNREFRRLPSGQRRRVAERVPEIAALRDRGVSVRSQVWSVISEASEQVERAREEKVRDLRGRLPELAVELSAQEEFRSARTAGIRTDVAAEFLPQHSDGYGVPTKLAKELAVLAHGKRRPIRQDGGLF